MKVRDLKAWLAALPTEADDADLTQCSPGGMPFTAKRVVIRRFKDGSGSVLCFVGMGTHLSDDFYSESEAVAPSLRSHA